MHKKECPICGNEMDFLNTINKKEWKCYKCTNTIPYKL